jgi:hypothetical protein
MTLDEGSNPGSGSEKVRDDQAILLGLRRDADARLLTILEQTLTLSNERLVKVEGTLVDLRVLYAERTGLLTSFGESQTKSETASEGHDKRIVELEKSMAGMKAWILIVGGITGVASFLAIVLR